MDTGPLNTVALCPPSPLYRMVSGQENNDAMAARRRGYLYRRQIEKANDPVFMSKLTATNSYLRIQNMKRILQTTGRIFRGAQFHWTMKFLHKSVHVLADRPLEKYDAGEELSKEENQAVIHAAEIALMTFKLGGQLQAMCCNEKVNNTLNLHVNAPPEAGPANEKLLAAAKDLSRILNATGGGDQPVGVDSAVPANPG